MAREGWFIETPFEVAGQSLLCEFGLTESDPNFGGLEVLGGEVFASVFQATRVAASSTACRSSGRASPGT